MSQRFPIEIHKIELKFFVGRLIVDLEKAEKLYIAAKVGTLISSRNV